MNPGPIEEAGQTARGLIAALKREPATLALVIFNIVFMAAIFFSVKDQREFNRQIISQLITNAAKAEEMLFKCIDPTRRSERPEAERTSLEPLSFDE